jgi:hypothetical protein
MSLVLEQITKHWLDLIQQAKEDKWEKFGAQASEANEFYQSDNHKFLFSRDNSSTSGLVVNSPKGSSHGSGLSFEATANLTANVVSVFLPVLYHKNPVRVLKPRVPAIPPDLLAEYRQAVAMEMMGQLQQQVAQNPALMADPQLQQAAMQLQQQVIMPAQPSGPTVKELEDRLRAYLIEAYLNYTPSEMGLKNHSRDAIIEAIVKGLGLLWVTVDNTGDRAIACLEYDSVDHLFKDPDAERDDDCMWIVRRRKRPAWEVERDFALEPGTLRGSDMSSDSQASTSLLDDLDREYETAQGKSSDQVVYYEVYSRMGIGGRLKAFDNSDDEELMQRLEEFGDHCYLAICPTHPTAPLNLPEEVVNYDETGDETARRLEWPIPFYKNRRNPWPFAGLSFRRKSRCAWPMSYVGPALGYQKCINWILSFLMARVKLVSRAFLLMPDGLDEEVYDTILYGSDLSLIKIKNEHPQAFEKFMEIVKMPQEDANIWQLLTQLKHEYEDATGVNELNLSARTNTQMRSAAEVDLKRDVLSVRPNDMASAVDAWMSDAAKLEAIAARYLLTATDVAPIFGEEAPDEVDMGMPEPVMQYGESTQLWVQLVSTDDIDKIVSEYEYTIESGSTRKPDKTQQVQNIDEGGSLVLQNFMQVWQQTGDPTKFNEYIAEWAKTREMTNWNVLLLPDMTQYMQQQQMMAAAAGGQPGGGAPADGGGPPQEEPPPQEQAA